MFNPMSSEEKIEKNCLFRLMPQMMVEVIKASNRPAQEMGQIRNNLVDGFSKLPDAMAKSMVQSLEHRQ